MNSIKNLWEKRIKTIQNNIITVNLKRTNSIMSSDKTKAPENIEPVNTPVYLKDKAYLRMIGYAYRYSNENIDPKNWKEVYGILIGTIKEKKKVVVDDAIPISVGGRSGIELDPIHYVDISQINMAMYKNKIEGEGDFSTHIIGWWHSHPGFGFFFSKVDTITHLGYQGPNPYAVGLIFDHTKKTSDFLGIAALRLKNPKTGIFSSYKMIEVQYFSEKADINKKIDKEIEKIRKNIDNVVREIEYIEEVLIEKALVKLQKEYGMLLIPKTNEVNSEKTEQYRMDEDRQFIWDSKFLKISYQIPKFRKNLESLIKKYESRLKNMITENQSNNINSQKKKYQKKIVSLLKPSYKLYSRIKKDYEERMEVINPFFNYLDTKERLSIEYFQKNVLDYFNILETLKEKGNFDSVHT